MKKQLLSKIIALFLFVPLGGFSQSASISREDLTGFWKGELYNDTTKTFLPYELVVSEEKGKLTGYSYTQFGTGEKNEWIVKKIRFKVKEDKLTIEDVEPLLNTFREPPPKGVRWMGIVTFSADDTSKTLSGIWSTSPTRVYSSATGSLQIRRAANYRPLTLFKKLDELDLENSISFIGADDKSREELAKQPRGEKRTDVEIAQRGENTVTQNQGDAVPNSIVPKVEETTLTTVKKASNTDDNPKGQVSTAVTRGSMINGPIDSKNNPEKTVASQGVTDKAQKYPQVNDVVITPKEKPVINNEPVTRSQSQQVKTLSPQGNEIEIGTKEQLAVNNNKPATKTQQEKSQTPGVNEKEIAKSDQSSTPNATAEEQKPVNPVPKPTINEPSSPLANNQASTGLISKPVEKTADKKDDQLRLPNLVNQQPVALTPTKLAPIVPVAAANVASRTISNTQEVFYKSDSLVLTLYDNGEVDGDTVSVLMNGSIIFARQGLTTKANSKVIYINPDTPDSLVLVMYAENLGSIPPNTGLLVVRDGESVYDVRFKADLQSNAAIVLRRKRKDK